MGPLAIMATIVFAILQLFVIAVLVSIHLTDKWKAEARLMAQEESYHNC